MLLDSSINLSYNRAFGEDTTPHKTSAPSQVEYSVIDSNSACITGVIEQDADIRVFGENLGIISAKAIDGRFFVRVRFDDEVNGTEIFLDAKSPDKAASDHVSLIISGVNNVGSARNVFIGSTSMLYKADYQVPYDLPADDMLSIYREELSESFGRIRENSGNNGVNMLLSIVPQKISVYTEGLNSELAAQSARLEQIRGTFAELLDDSGIETLDLSEMLKKRASSDKMLYQTSESITDLAYYYMYCAITARLYDMTDEYKWAFMPIRPENFMEYTMPVTTGEHTSLLGFDEKAVTETVTRLKYENSKKIVNVSDGSKIYFGGKATLPTAVIVCDRIGEPLLDLLSEHFRYCYVLRINETVVPDDVLSAVDPDFIIYICDEGKIDFTVGY